MLAACQAALPADVAVFAAAVADWRVAERRRGQKIKKDGGGAAPALTWCPTRTSWPPSRRRAPGDRALVIGFAAETST